VDLLLVEDEPQVVKLLLPHLTRAGGHAMQKQSELVLGGVADFEDLPRLLADRRYDLR
jgi:hypothetical protein